MSKRQSEVQLGKAVVQWFEDAGWDVYQEVPLRGPAPDIVALRGSVVAIVECKMSFGLDVIAQAKKWLSYGPRAHLVYVAVPREQKTSDGRRLGVNILHDIGIGLIEVDMRRHDDVRYSVTHHRGPLHRRADTTVVMAAIRQEHKTHLLAGSASSKRFTPFVETCRNVHEFVKANPGCSMGDAVRGISHHYSTDKSALGALWQWASSGKIPGVRVQVEGKRRLLFEDTQNG